MNPFLRSLFASNANKLLFLGELNINGMQVNLIHSSTKRVSMTAVTPMNGYGTCLDCYSINNKLRKLLNPSQKHLRQLLVGDMSPTTTPRNSVIRYLNLTSLYSTRSAGGLLLINTNKFSMVRRLAAVKTRALRSDLESSLNVNLVKRLFNTSSTTSKASKPPPPPLAESSASAPKVLPKSSEAELKTTTTTSGIFQKFKEAYKQHGKILLYCHIITCCGWITGFFFLAKSGYDISNFLALFEKAHLISHETAESVVHKINTFDLKVFMRSWHFDYVLPERSIEWLGNAITGQTLNYCITAVAFYKIFTPLRYLLTLGVTKLVIQLFKKRGLMPLAPPPGSSIRDLYKEQQLVIRRGLRKTRERYSATRVGRLLDKTKIKQTNKKD